MLTLDHLVVTTGDLAAGTRAIEARLGQPFAPGGHHAAMGTHNRLISLGPDAYLEVIAIDPDAPAPQQKRWFALDHAAGPARLSHWAARTPDLAQSLAAAPPGTGRIWDMARGDLRWQMAIPETGQQPMGGLYPALLHWQVPHPAPRLPDRGLRLVRLTLTSPEAPRLRDALSGQIEDPRITVADGPIPAIMAQIETPDGRIDL